MRDAAGVYRPEGLQVLTIIGDQIAEMHAFLSLRDHLFTRFSLALVG